MECIYSSSKNGDLTCSINNIFLHSTYNPINEAKKFVDNIQCDFIPEKVFICEPALSYVAEFLKKKFNNSKIIAIRYTTLFSKYDNLFDKVIYNIDEIYTEISEDNYSRMLFLSWKPSEKIFEAENEFIWSQIKRCIKFQRDIVGTKAFFNYKWLKNSLNFFTKKTNYGKIKNIDCPIIITASGPTLKDSLPFIKQYRENFFLIAVSSSLSVLFNSKIVPDLCISTDGGFWAKKHLETIFKYQKQNINFPLAISSESSIPNSLFETTTIIPLFYNDDLEKELFNSCKVPFNYAKRNGTVSGTACELALSLTNHEVAIAGLDLCSSKGYQHAQPNNLELFNNFNDNFFNSLIQRQYISEKNSGSLNVYAHWFKNQRANFYNRLYRLNMDNKNNTRDLSPLKDITINRFINLYCKNKTKKFIIEKNIYLYDLNNKKNILKILHSIHEKIINYESSNNIFLWLEYLSYGDYILYKKFKTEDYKKKLYEKANLNICKILKKMEFEYEK